MMHDLLQEMGREIVRLKSPNEPGRCSRLWLLNDAEHVMTNNTGTEAIEGIYVESIESGAEVDVTPKSFSMMHKLRYLKIKNAKLPKGLEFLPNSLRILDWTRYPLKSLPAHFNPQKLWELNLCHSCLEHVQIGKECLYNLKTLNLSHSLNLVTTPNFKDMPFLELVSLEGCTRLYAVDQGIEMLGRLSLLDLEGCKNLVHFACTVSGLKSLKVLNLSGCSKLKKLPNDMGHLESLEEFHVSGTDIRQLPSSIGMLERLFLLKIEDCNGLVCLPSSVGGLKSLKDLNLSGCSKLDKLPDELGHVAYLEKLDLSRSGIRQLPSFIGLLKNLKELSLAECKAQSVKSWNPFELLRKRSHIPAGLSLPSLFGLHSLTDLNLSDCNLYEEAMPDSFGCLALLKKLNLGDNQFARLPESISQLSRLEYLYVNGCHKLQVLPEFGSDVWVGASNCISLESLTNQTGQCNSVVGGNFSNCFKMLENESYKSLALPLLARYLESKTFCYHGASFFGPGNEIPEGYNHQSVGSSVTVELHPGWLSENFMGFACCVILYNKPLPSWVEYWSVGCSFRANGQLFEFPATWIFGGKWGQPMLDHIWFHYISRDSCGVCLTEFQVIYCQLEFFFHLEGNFNKKVVPRLKKCGVRVVYENGVEELQTLLKQSNTEPSLQKELNNPASTMHDPVVEGQAMSLEILGGSGSHPLSPANLKPRFGEPVKDHQLQTHSTAKDSTPIVGLKHLLDN